MTGTSRPASEGEATAQFLFGLRIGVLAVVVTVLLSLSMLRNPTAYRPFGVQIAAFAALAGIVAVEVGKVIRRTSWTVTAGRVALAVALAAMIASCWSLPAGGAATSADWAYGAVGWIGVIVLLDRPLRELVIFVTLMAIINLVSLVPSTGADSAALLNFAAASIGTIGYPLAVGFGAATLRHVAQTAHAATSRAAQIQADEALATVLHEHRQQRFDDLSVSALPLLQGLADGMLNPEAPDVQRSCAIEAARIRRLLAETDDVPDQFDHELRHCIDVAERRRVTVELQRQGHGPDPPVDVRRALIEAPMAALATATSWARVTMTRSPDLIVLTTVSDSDLLDIPTINRSDAELTVLRDGSTLWVEVQWKPPSPQSSSTTMTSSPPESWPGAQLPTHRSTSSTPTPDS